MQITTIGIDLAKNLFQVRGANEHGKPVLRKQLKRDPLVAFFSNLSPCLIGMEACGEAHHWARKLQALGHTVKLIAPQVVRPYVKSNKNDVAEAEAICEAVGRPTMRFVPIKNIEQQSVLAFHRPPRDLSRLVPRKPTMLARGTALARLYLLAGGCAGVSPSSSGKLFGPRIVYSFSKFSVNAGLTSNSEMLV